MARHKDSKKEKEIITNMKRQWAIQCSNKELYCFLCGNIITSMNNCNADHWIPKALGGKTTEDNLKPSHTSCNLKKSCASPEMFLKYKNEILSGTYKVREPYKITPKALDLNKKQRKRIAKSKQQFLYTIGSSIYYIKESLSEIPYDFEIKEGIIIGFTYKENTEYALVKDFYTNTNNQIESQLLEVLPLSKEQAYIAKNNYEKQVQDLLTNQSVLGR